jgi:hypothetical protein
MQHMIALLMVENLYVALLFILLLRGKYMHVLSKLPKGFLSVR